MLGLKAFGELGLRCVALAVEYATAAFGCMPRVF